MRRVVTFRSGRSPGLRVNLTGPTLPIGMPTVGPGLYPRLQWRYHGGFSPPSLFSLGGHLNGQWLYIFAEADDMPPHWRLSRVAPPQKFVGNGILRCEDARLVSPLAVRRSLSDYRRVVNRFIQTDNRPCVSLFPCLESSEAGRFRTDDLPPVF